MLREASPGCGKTLQSKLFSKAGRFEEEKGKGREGSASWYSVCKVNLNMISGNNHRCMPRRKQAKPVPHEGSKVSGDDVSG